MRGQHGVQSGVHPVGLELDRHRVPAPLGFGERLLQVVLTGGRLVVDPALASRLECSELPWLDERAHDLRVVHQPELHLAAEHAQPVDVELGVVEHHRSGIVAEDLLHKARPAHERDRPAGVLVAELHQSERGVATPPVEPRGLSVDGQHRPRQAEPGHEVLGVLPGLHEVELDVVRQRH